MRNSIETILGDMKKMVKEMEIAYGDIKPQVCDVSSVGETCPNNNCWVNRARNDYFERVCELEEKILCAITDLEYTVQSSTQPLEVSAIIKRLKQSIMKTDCNECVKKQNCVSAYKARAIHSETCDNFQASQNDTSPKVAIQF